METEGNTRERPPAASASSLVFRALLDEGRLPVTSFDMDSI